MPDTASTALLGAALGGVIATVGGWLNNWGVAKREREKDGRSARRAAYTQFLYAGQALYSEVASVLQEAAAKPIGDPRIVELKAIMHARFVELRSAQVSLDLAAPTPISTLAHSQADLLRGFIAVTEQALSDMKSIEFYGDNMGDRLAQIFQLAGWSPGDPKRDRLLGLMKQDLDGRVRSRT